MRLEIEDIIFSYLRSEIAPEFNDMLVRGHSTINRHIPYISLDVGDIKPFNDMLETDGIFESEVNVAIADSAHAINYNELFRRISAVKEALEKFTFQSKYICEGLWFTSETDARDDNNLGVVLTYRLVFQTT